MDPRKQVEQIEVIERSVTELRRPISSTEALSYLPTSEVRTTRESYTTSGLDLDRRFHLTGERDFSREPSFLHTISPPVIPYEPPLQQSTPERVNQFGYDLHEVQTSEGGARIVQTLGGGETFGASPLSHSSLLMHDRSLETTTQNRTGASSFLRSGAKEVAFVNGARTSPLGPYPYDSDISRTSEQQPISILKTSGDSWRQAVSSDDGSLTRKDSYKRMQESQMNASLYAPSSKASMIPRDSQGAQEKWSFAKASASAASKARGCWQITKDYFVELYRQIREAEWTPQLILNLLLLLLFVIFLIIILWVLISAIFSPYSVRSFLLYPPVCEECLKKNPTLSSYRPPSKLYVHFASPATTQFELLGNPPFKSNSFTAVDFDTGYVAIADHALTDEQGKHTSCFLMKLDRTAMPSMDDLVYAIKNTDSEVHTQFGWQEYWQYIAEPIDASYLQGKFKDDINDCQNVKWYLLKQSVYTKDESCTDCYDFCLPDYAIIRKQKYEDDVTIGIRRLNCFRLYVPEWSRFQMRSDDTGGHWQYPHNPEYTQRDAYGNWVNWAPQGQATGTF
uniref:BRICHOS domain-containing protein n=1 Tax=Acrobeloides nanus TaxID=290746 RepID=A0A914E1J9_9BILA